MCMPAPDVAELVWCACGACATWAGPPFADDDGTLELLAVPLAPLCTFVAGSIEPDCSSNAGLQWA